MRFNEKLAALRKEKNASQEKLAEYLGISRQSVAKWESGESLPEIDRLIQLSDYFMVSMDSLIRDESCQSRQPGKPRGENRENRVIDFLCRAKKITYAGKGAEVASSRLNSHDLAYEENDLSYYDTYLGSEFFSGQEAVWQSGEPLWSMNYYGRVLHESFSGNFLKEALGLVTAEYPFRGPLIHHDGNYSYHCSVNGGFGRFKGAEEIFYGDAKVYECLFHGGSIK